MLFVVKKQLLTYIFSIIAEMNRLQIECRTCGSTYEIASEGAGKINQGSISCFVCAQPIFAYDGFINYYPFLKQRKEKHIKFDPDSNLSDFSSFDKESNG